MNFPTDNETPTPRRILWVFAWLVVGGEETEVRLLARNLEPHRYTIDVIACFHQPNMPAQTHLQLEEMGVDVDQTPYNLSFEETVEYLAHKVPHYDLVIACQAVGDIYAAYENLHARGIQTPPLIEHGGLVAEALQCRPDLATQYVGVCDSIRAAAATISSTRFASAPNASAPNAYALMIPSIVDLSEFDDSHRKSARDEWKLENDVPVIGWVGRLDRKKRVEDFVRAAEIARQTKPNARFFVIGGPDAFMPQYEIELHRLSEQLGLSENLKFLGDRDDVPRLLAGLDVLVWLSRDEGMPHIISEAGAARLPVVATRDNGSEEQIEDGHSGLFVAHQAPGEVAAQIVRLLDDKNLRHRLGENLRRKVENEYSAPVVTRQWEALFDEVLAQSSTR